MTNPGQHCHLAFRTRSGAKPPAATAALTSADPSQPSTASFPSSCATFWASSSSFDIFGAAAARTTTLGAEALTAAATVAGLAAGLAAATAASAAGSSLRRTTFIVLLLRLVEGEVAQGEWRQDGQDNINGAPRAAQRGVRAFRRPSAARHIAPRPLQAHDNRYTESVCRPAVCFQLIRRRAHGGVATTGPWPYIPHRGYPIT